MTSKRPETDPLGTEVVELENHSPAKRVTSNPFPEGQQSLLAAIVESSDDAIIVKIKESSAFGTEALVTRFAGEWSSTSTTSVPSG